MKNYKEITQQLYERAWKDEAFKRRLFNEPKSVLKEMGVNIPDSVEIKFHENTSDTINVVLPRNPADLSLSDEQLDQVSGGDPWSSTPALC